MYGKGTAIGDGGKYSYGSPDNIAGEEKAITERNVDVQLVGLRRKLGDWGAKIETVRGVGYRIAP